MTNSAKTSFEYEQYYNTTQKVLKM
jgi:hypothetical protein